MNLHVGVLFCSFQVEREDLKDRILNGTVVYPESFSENSRSLCDALMAKEVDKRMGFRNNSCDEIRVHPFFADINWRRLDAGTQTHTHTLARSHTHKLGPIVH